MLGRSALSRPFAGVRIVPRQLGLNLTFKPRLHTNPFSAAMASSTATTDAPTNTQTPMEDSIRTKLTEAFSPTLLEIHNDSHLHSHHKAMEGSSSKETHFRLVITSNSFASVRQPARHRMVYALLKDEMARDGGIHALQLRTRTPEEDERAKQLEEGS